MIIPDEAKVALASALRQSTSGAQRAAVIDTYAREWGVSTATAYRHAGVQLRERASRPAAPDPVLDQVVALWLSSATEKYSTATMPIADVIDMCETAGVLEPHQVSVAQFRRYIRAHHITLRDQRRGTPHVHLASPHPNWTHLADVSRCRQWYLQNDGRLDVQSYKRGTAEYRNKDLRGLPLYRYVLADHASGILYVQYFTDETVPTLLTFLAGAWLPKKQRFEVGPTGKEAWWPAPFDADADYDTWATLPALRDYHFRGAPRVLVLDRASANQSEFTAQLSERLGIKLIIASEARAKGAVETAMWIWERKFEARLAIQPARDLHELNVYALDFAARWSLKAVHSRHGMTRSQAWALITAEQLRELPAWPIFQELARREPEPRTVKSGEPGCGLIYHEGRAWKLPDASLIGQIVHVSYSVFNKDSLEVRAPDGRVFVLEEMRRDRFGFFEEAPVIGERFVSHPETVTQKTEKRLAAVRAALPELQVFGRERERGDVPALLPPRQGAEISVTTEMGAREITRRQFNERALAQLGRSFTEAEGAERDRRFEGKTTVPEAAVDEFVSWCRTQAQPAASPKVVNLFR